MVSGNIAGVVLAGGRSSRMGQNKALLHYKGAPLIDHMIGLLHEAGLKDVYISGEVEGYNNISDSRKFNGPACAIIDVFTHLKGCDGALFIPVDMPLLTAEVLQYLLQNKNGGYFEKCPLPVFIARFCAIKNAYSVQKLLNDLGVDAIKMPQEYNGIMRNFNTPEDWQKVDIR